MQFTPIQIGRSKCCKRLTIRTLAKTAKNETFHLAIQINDSDLRRQGHVIIESIMKSRKFYKDIINHCYQRTADNGVLFYTVSDHLVYFTIYCVVAKKHGIKVLSLCQMPDHIHDAVIAKSQNNLTEFKREVNSRFARGYNKYCGTKGPVFEMPFGSAPKYGDKKARSVIVYIGNNPVERLLVTYAEEYRWNYLAYAFCPHPFSEKIVIRRSSKALRAAVKVVKAEYKAGRPLNYTLIKNMTKELSPSERQQFTDFVISTYNVIDFNAACKFFDTYSDMIASMHAITGSEHDLNEVFVGKSDKPYSRMTSIITSSTDYKDIHQILALDKDAKWQLFLLLREKTNVMGAQIYKFLHLG